MRGVRAVVCLGALLALVACDSDRPESEGQSQPAPAVQPAAQPEPPALPAPSEPAAAPPSVAPEPQPAPKVITQPPVLSRPVAPTGPPAAPKPTAPSQPAVPVAPAPAASERPLDLSLPGALDEVFPLPDATLSVPGVGEETPDGLLPPLFKAEEERQSSFELGGRLITTENPEEDGEGYWDSVEGAELQLRFRR